jgi:uncharacterized protein (DUF2126 family)
MSSTAIQQLPRQRISTRIGELCDALDGFPVEALITDCLGTNGAGPAAQARMATLVDRVLDQWIARLGHDIDQMSPSTQDALKAIAQRTRATRDALVEVRSLFDRLALPHAGACAAAAQAPPPAAQGRPPPRSIPQPQALPKPA